MSQLRDAATYDVTDEVLLDRAERGDEWVLTDADFPGGVRDREELRRVLISMGVDPRSLSE